MTADKGCVARLARVRASNSVDADNLKDFGLYPQAYILYLSVKEILAYLSG